MNNTFRRTLLLILMLSIGMLSLPRSAQASSVACANPTINSVSFGNVSLQSGTVNINGSISWSCTSTGILGILLSPEGATATAGYDHLIATGFLSPSDRVVLFNTGSGNKYTDVLAHAFGLDRTSAQT